MRAHWIPNLTLLGASVFVALLMGEGILRFMEALEPCKDVPSTMDPTLWALRPAHLDFRRHCPEFDTRFTSNSSGFRGPEFPPVEKATGKQRLLFLGDSFTEGLGVEEDERFARLIANDLNGRADAVILGYAGSSPVHALNYYRRIGRQYHPDVVVHEFYTVNDILEHSRDFTVQGSGKTVTVTGILPYPDENWRVWIGRHSRVVQLLYDRVYRPLRLMMLKEEAGAKKTARQASGPFFKFTREGYADLEQEHAWEYTRDVMEELRNEVEADGGKFVVIVIPPHMLVQTELQQTIETSMQDYIPKENWDFGAVYTRVLEEFAKSGFTVVDPLGALRKGVTPSERTYFRIDPHLTPKGHRIVADEALPVIERPLSASR
jgi:lysophospholipase L1-like esterase